VNWAGETTGREEISAESTHPKVAAAVAPLGAIVGCELLPGSLKQTRRNRYPFLVCRTRQAAGPKAGFETHASDSKNH
jgi:hypothetical protein